MRSPRTSTKGSPCSPQLEKAHAQQRRPNAAKKKKKKKEVKKHCQLVNVFLIVQHFNFVVTEKAPSLGQSVIISLPCTDRKRKR